MGKYVGYKKNPENYSPCLHSEVSAIIRLGENDCSKYTFVNVRIDNNNKINIAKPCQNCMNVLAAVGFKKILYTTKDNFREI